MILALETATNICSVSFQDREGKIHEKRIERRGSHSEYLFLFIRELMNEHNFKIPDLDAVLVCNGPGSYTGLRIAASAVKGLLFGLNVNVFAANTLAGFAEGVVEHKRKQSTGEKDKAGKKLAPEELQINGAIHSVINARRSHLYHQQFRFDGSLNAVSESQILDLEVIEKKIKTGDIIVGTGIERLNDFSISETEQFGLEAINAGSLIRLFSSKSGNEYFTKTSAEELESNYISSSQV